MLGAATKDTGESSKEQTTFSLFAFPAECNFSGQKLDFSWTGRVQAGALNELLGCGGDTRWMVLLDAAKHVSTSPLRLDGEHRPDFVTLSFYKMFGYPTGLGALLIRRESAACLEKKTFAGGEESEEVLLAFLCLCCLHPLLPCMSMTVMTCPTISVHNKDRYPPFLSAAVTFLHPT